MADEKLYPIAVGGLFIIKKNENRLTGKIKINQSRGKLWRNSMIIYRYENKNTGDGPFLSFEGVNPSDNKIYNNGYLYGCKTKKELIAYMKEHNKYNLKNYHIDIYNIPDEEVIIRKREVLFPKQYSLFYKEPVSTIPQAFWAGE